MVIIVIVTVTPYNLILGYIGKNKPTKTQPR